MPEKKDFGSRVIAALARHERAAGELGLIKKGIVKELEKCPITIEAYQNSDLNCDFLNVSEEDHNRLWDGSRVRHHLHEVLGITTNEGGDYDRDRKLREDEIRAELQGMGDDDDQPHACPHCLAAWLLIERRKDVRQELGRARRSLRQLGKSAMKVTT